jgi:hypothetical protein
MVDSRVPEFLPFRDRAVTRWPKAGMALGLSIPAHLLVTTDGVIEYRLLRRVSPEVAPNGRGAGGVRCPFVGVERTSFGNAPVSESDPIETSASHRRNYACCCFQAPNDPTLPQCSRIFQAGVTSARPGHMGRTSLPRLVSRAVVGSAVPAYFRWPASGRKS